jgi:TetR/AcrR family transcriptional regulator, repressor for neighboring sulfatase
MAPRTESIPARVRRTPSEARRRILETAEARLAEGGPEAVRVQRIAADLGITDAAIYHHFGSREGLLDALARFGARRLREGIEEILSGWDAEELPISALVDAIVDTFERRRYAKLILWLADAGIAADRGSGMFDVVVRAFERRSAAGATRPRRRDPLEPRFVAALLVMVCAAEPLVGSMSRRSVGLAGHRAMAKRFRAWLAEELESMLARS